VFSTDTGNGNKTDVLRSVHIVGGIALSNGKTSLFPVGQYLLVSVLITLFSICTLTVFV